MRTPLWLSVKAAGIAYCAGAGHLRVGVLLAAWAAVDVAVLLWQDARKRKRQRQAWNGIDDEVRRG